MTPLERLTDAVDALTRPAVHRTRYTYRNSHGTLVTDENVVPVVSLLDQLGHTTTPGSGVSLDSGHAVPGSRPTGRLEALDVLMAIDVECTQLLGIYGGTDRNDLPANLRGLVGLASGLEDDGRSDLARTACRWVSRAQSVTGWADPAWRPNNACPLCEAHHSLRVRVITAVEVHASCVACGEVWTPDTINLLAAYIRWENGEHDSALEETA